VTVASVAIRTVLERPARPATVLGAGASAVYLAAGEDVVAVVRRGGVALPNALVVDGPLPVGGPATVGGGLVRVGAWTACPDAWWDPRPHCGVSTSRVYLAFGRHTAVRVGRGPGLTPADDDLLAGALATLVALGHPAAAPLWAQVEPLLCRTTLLSAALLRHAARGEMAVPAARFLEALCGAGDARRAERRLREVGHTSGGALAEGIRAAWAVAA
jgi:hypothetical protein